MAFVRNLTQWNNKYNTNWEDGKGLKGGGSKKVTHHAFLNVLGTCLEELCQARNELPFLGGTQVIQGIEVEVLCQMTWHGVKGIQEPAGPSQKSAP